MLLSGNNCGLPGDVWLTAGGVGLGQRHGPLGTGTVFLQGSLMAEFGPRTLSNPIYCGQQRLNLGGAYNTGANNLTLAGGVSLTNNRKLAVNYPQLRHFCRRGRRGDRRRRTTSTSAASASRYFTAPATYSGNDLRGQQRRHADPAGQRGPAQHRLRSKSAVRRHPPDRQYRRQQHRPHPRRGQPQPPVRLVRLHRRPRRRRPRETLWDLNIAGNYQYGQNVLTQVSTAPGSSVALTFNSLNTNNQPNILNFIGVGAEIGSAANQIRFNHAPILSGRRSCPTPSSPRRPSWAALTQVATDFVGYDTLLRQRASTTPRPAPIWRRPRRPTT